MLLKTALQGFAAGAAAMYFLDPSRGKRRRTGLRDQAGRTLRELTRQMDKAGRDLSNRSRGMLAAVKSAALQPDRTVVAERVKSRIGRVVSHPHAISVTSDDGLVKLKGLVLEHELNRLLQTVKSVPGVRQIRNELEVHNTPEHISSLQGGTPRESRWEFARQNWTPSLRVGAGTLGGGLILYGIRTGGLRGIAGGLAGAALLTRAVANREFRKIVGIGSGAHVVNFEKAVHIEAPPEEVYAFWTNYTNFPRFMAHLQEVRDLGNGKSHWVAAGPSRIPISWDAELTEQVPNRKIAWRSVPGSQVHTEGVVRFDPNGNGGTRVGIRLCYGPPAGMLGHVIASLFGSNPRQEMNDDLVRLKSLIELGKTRAHGKRITLEELGKPISV
jgi:uncharacterized membrane protein